MASPEQQPLVLPPPFHNARIINFNASNSTSFPAPTTDTPTSSSDSQQPDANTLELLTQGAEAHVFRTTFLTSDTPCALKYRPPKPYRHTVLDRRLTKGRILAEARVLVRCRREGVRVPAVLGVDWDAGWILLEWIPGLTIRRCLDAVLHPEINPTVTSTPPSTTTTSTTTATTGSSDPPSTTTTSSPPSTSPPKIDHPSITSLMTRVGRTIGHMHSLGITHGDLTTSNLMLRPPSSTLSPTPQDPSSTSSSLEGDIYLIDFGLSSQNSDDEDRAVDLYVLERAFISTHPRAEGLFQEVLRAYGDSYKGGRGVLGRLEGVRMRGRKRSMLG